MLVIVIKRDRGPTSVHEERNAPTETKEMLATTADDDELQFVGNARPEETKEDAGAPWWSHRNWS